MKKVIVVLVFSFFALSPIITFAQATLPSQVQFGGYSVWSLPCTCTGGLYSVHFFLPLYLNSKTPSSGALTVPTLLKYPNFRSRAAAWFLGKYTPGPGGCWMAAVPSCVLYPTLGTVSASSGSSK